MNNSILRRALGTSTICLLILLQLPQAKGDVGASAKMLTSQKTSESVTKRVSQKANSPETLDARVCDFDGDGKADLAIYILPMTWLVKFNVGSPACTWGANCKGYTFNLGTTGTDIIVVGDYDNAPGTPFKRTNLAVRQGLPLTPMTSSTYTYADDPFLPSTGGVVTFTHSFTFGYTTDVPVMGDYDGDQLADYTSVRPNFPTTGLLTWYVHSFLNGPITQTQWGNVGDFVIPGDYNGDSITDIAVWRPSNGTWYWLVSPAFNSGQQFQWGTTGDKPLLGDFDGDSKDDFVVFRPSTGTWHIRLSGTGVLVAQPWGLSTDIPVPADYDGDGKTDIAVYRPSTYEWFILGSNNGFMYDQFGYTGFKPVAAEYVKPT